MSGVGAIFKFVSRKHSSEKLEREGGGLQISQSVGVIIVVQSEVSSPTYKDEG